MVTVHPFVHAVPDRVNAVADITHAAAHPIALSVVIIVIIRSASIVVMVVIRISVPIVIIVVASIISMAAAVVVVIATIGIIVIIVIVMSIAFFDTYLPADFTCRVLFAVNIDIYVAILNFTHEILEVIDGVVAIGPCCLNIIVVEGAIRQVAVDINPIFVMEEGNHYRAILAPRRTVKVCHGNIFAIEDIQVIGHRVFIA